MMKFDAQTNLAPERLARMVEVSRVLNSTTKESQLLEYILDEATDLTAAESASLLLFDEQTRELRFKAAAQGMPESLLATPVPIDSSIAGAIFVAEKPMIINDAQQDERWHPQVDRKINFHTESILGVPMHNGENKVIGVLETVNKKVGKFNQDDVNTLAILADIAGVAIEKARLFTELTTANQRLNELDELKSNFISIASHELRTPLSVILGYASFLKGSADPEVESQVDSVLDAAIRLRGLIQDMLNLRYIDTGAISLQQERVDLIGLVRSIVERQDETVQAQRLTLRIDMPDHQVLVLGDTKMLELIVGNLLNNAIKYTPAGGYIRAKVTMRNQEEVWLSIRDTGVGIPQDKLTQVFDRFYQVENPLTRRFEGMGLGLSIVRELTEIHKGRVWARSEIDHGSEFFVALPVASIPVPTE